MSRSARAAAAALGALTILALAAPIVELVVGLEHDVPSLLERHCRPGWPHVLGCDDIGQDLLLRLLFGARVSLAVGLGAALLSTVIGTLIGAAAGFARGPLDAVIMRVVDTMLAIPLLPLLLLASAMAIGAGPDTPLWSVVKLVALLGAFGWMGVARIARAEALRLGQLDFVVAARALGARPRVILVRHVLPNALPPILVAATIDVGRNILAEASLSFLGLGIQPPTPSWGNMLRHAEDAIATAPGLAFWPGACIVMTVVSVYVLGEALRAALDPRTHLSATPRTPR